MASSTKWIKIDTKGDPQACAPPDWAAQAVAARGTWPGLRPLEGVTEAPLLRPDGSVLAAAGYDAPSGFLY